MKKGGGSVASNIGRKLRRNDEERRREVEERQST
jgi:hypothetical protein